jgi:ATP-dependent RNA helicase RhlE
MPHTTKQEKTTETPETVATTESSTFADLGLEPQILEILAKHKFTTPTPIQQKSIPAAVEGKDIIGIAQTGTGKTMAFALPIIQRLSKMDATALILLPTRELAVQVEEAFRMVGWPLGATSVVLIGGTSMYRQVQELRHRPHVIIGTPGRIIDHIQQKTLSLKDVKILALDEADRMLDMGFAPQLKKILETVSKDRQTLLFSATMPAEIVKIATQHMKLPLRIEIAKAGTASERVEQEVFIVRGTQKIRLLEVILEKYKGTVLIFCRTKHGAKKICEVLNKKKIPAAEIHSNRSFSQRQAALRNFKAGTTRVLVATDIASRGIDVKGIELVINYDIPEQAEDYIHRIGRTGRADHRGNAITFAMPEQGGKVRQIENLMRMTLRVSKLPELPADTMSPADTAVLEHSSTPRRGGYGARSSSGGRSSSYSGRPSGGGRSSSYGGRSSGDGRSSSYGSSRPHAPARSNAARPAHSSGVERSSRTPSHAPSRTPLRASAARSLQSSSAPSRSSAPKRNFNSQRPAPRGGARGGAR